MPCYMKDQPDGRMFICGNLGDHCAECGWVGDYLCDYPVGEGKTCDRPLCETHANEIAPDLHYCAAHQGMWKAYRDSGGVQRELDNVVPFRGAQRRLNATPVRAVAVEGTVMQQEVTK